jgi:hypothetical protein
MWHTWKNCKPGLQFVNYINPLPFRCHSAVCICSAGKSHALNDRSYSTPRILTLSRILSTSVWNVWIIWSNLDYYCLFPNYKCNQSKKMKNFPTGKKAKEHFKAIYISLTSIYHYICFKMEPKPLWNRNFINNKIFSNLGKWQRIYG